MTTRELIALLQSKDPSGNMRVFIAEGDGTKCLTSTLDNPQIVEICERHVADSPYNDAISDKNIGEKVLVL